MSYDDKPHFSELIWEGDEKNMAVPSREDVRAEEAKRSAKADKNRSLAEKSRGLPERPEQLKLWDLELPGRREEKRSGRIGAAVPRRDETVHSKEGDPRKQVQSYEDRYHTASAIESRKEEFPAGWEISSQINRSVTEQATHPYAGPGRDNELASVSRPATTESQFVERARELADYTEASAEFVKFKSYWPTYGHMTGPQTKWYFYWRNEVRHGRYPETDLSYIFLHVYELINGVGWDTPQDGHEQLSGLWEAYRGTFKRLDHYLGGWIADFSFIHELDIPLREIVVRAKGLGGDLAELELARCLTFAPEQLTLPALSLMSDYDITKSKFYTGPGSQALERFVPKVVALIDAYVRRKHGTSLLEMFPPDPPVTRERYLFRSAVYDISLYGYSVLVPVARVSKSPPLRSLVTRLFRLTENKLRALMDFRGRLKGISIDKEIEELVGKFLEREFRNAQLEEKGPDIVIDQDRLEQLRSDSDAVRQLLMVEEPAEEKPSVERPVTDLSTVDGPVALGLYEQDGEEQEWERISAVHSADDGARVPEKQEPAEALAPFGGPQNTTSAAGNEWESLADALSPLQREAVLALSGPEGPAALHRLAAAHAALPDLLIDEINEIAMDLLGDLLIDGEELSPEYASMLHFFKR
ncbi:TerB N-terminal domain-containing protein [Paenibacillus durus]|uniref:TerB N-terminal domain-containing protein n=1 Tax=Paenibacillus durus TaxID=44251 RepID=UPI00130E41B7|nr:TerB N-terminal domain-containing protein [Paenibacillus durus]